MHNCNKQLLYALLQLATFVLQFTSFVCTSANQDNFLCTATTEIGNTYPTMHYNNYYLFRVLYQLTNCVCRIVIEKNYALLKVTAVICSIATVEYSMLEIQHQNPP